LVEKTEYQKVTGAEETCKECPHPVCPKRDNSAFECPARVGERATEKAFFIINKAYLELQEKYRTALRKPRCAACGKIINDHE
jgi:predicted RNA-binding Zn-ribbon protein involved in translation (DUF1610 family)